FLTRCRWPYAAGDSNTSVTSSVRCCYPWGGTVALGSGRTRHLKRCDPKERPMPVEQSEDRQTERPVCLANAHDSLIRIIENPKNHIDGWTPIDRIQTRLPREYGYTVKDIRACLSGCLASYVEVRADQHGTTTHARRTDA